MLFRLVTHALPLIIALAAHVIGCHQNVELAGNRDSASIDNSPDGPDSDALNPFCDVGAAACNNCTDDDQDGLIDGFDPHCISILDDREDSFATGIPGDNMDAIKQDCFFDGDSGSGNDGCDLHTCCFLDGPCPPEYMPQLFDPNACTPTPACIETCQPITPPGCDCFGCCTICDDQNECTDIIINPTQAPNCDIDVLDDPNLCPPCTKIEACSTPCEPTGCILCPGQSADDLPPECNGNACPDGLATCTTTAECDGATFCANGCCITQIE